MSAGGGNGGVANGGSGGSGGVTTGASINIRGSCGHDGDTGGYGGGSIFGGTTKPGTNGQFGSGGGGGGAGGGSGGTGGAGYIEIWEFI
jgi:hypothetical protein